MTWPNDTGTDFEYWNKKQYWEIFEAGALIEGIDPRIFDSERRENQSVLGPRYAFSDFPEFQRTMHDLIRLARANEIRHIEDIDNPDMPMFWAVRPKKIRSLFPEAFNDQKPAIEVQTVNPTKHNTNLLSQLDAARVKFWDNYDPTDTTTAPRNEDVKSWLVSNGVSKTIAASMATILRADGLPTGPR